MELSPSVSVLGLHAYDSPQLPGMVFGEFYGRMRARLQGHGVQPTFVAAEGKGYSGKFTKVGGKTERRLVDTGFEGIAVLSLAANPAGSDEPSYDAFASASLVHLPEISEVIACCVMNEAIVPFQTPAFLDWLWDVVGLIRWDYGYGFSDRAKRQPDLFVLGLDSGQLSADEQRALAAWYTAPPQARADRLRDVFPYALVNERQLGRGVGDGRTLRDYIATQKGASLGRSTDYGLQLWTTATDSVAKAREDLRRSGVLVA